jgi:hypothetical protein
MHKVEFIATEAPQFSADSAEHAVIDGKKAWKTPSLKSLDIYATQLGGDAITDVSIFDNPS